MLNLFVLMYADDTVIMAENEHDMQRNLNLLNEYCNCNKLKVNPLAGRATFLSPTVHGRSDNIVVFP